MQLGLRLLLHDLRGRRERFRQFLGLVFIVLVSALGRPVPVSFAAGVGLVLLGSGIRLWASGHIKKNARLATDGPYAFVRHPLYVGNLTVLLGFALASGLWWSFVLVAAMVAMFYPPAIHTEDTKLHRLFGQEWERWRARTRALMPRLTPYRGSGGGGWSFVQSLRQNGEPLIATLLLALIGILFVKLP